MPFLFARRFFGSGRKTDPSFFAPRCRAAGDIHHINTAESSYSRLLCGTDHCRRPRFHLEVEKNSLQTPARRR